MNSARIADLDELSLTVRDPISRSYISESINAYRGGAYRSSIMSTWIAVSYDLIAKLRELASQDDANAVQWINRLDNAIRNNQISTLQMMEEELLDKAQRDFELFASHELEDLQRLKRDRNLCAHPAFIAEDLLFQPTPDLVRTHLVHAILHVLSQMPVQGKSALNKLKEDLLRPSFPDNIESVYVFLNTKYLNRARSSLIQSMIDVLIKTLLKSDDPDFAGKEKTLILALQAVSRRYPQVYEQRMVQKYPDIVDALNDDQLLSSIQLVRLDRRCWEWMRESSRIRIKQILSRTQPKSFVELTYRYKIFNLLDIDELKPFLLNIFENLDEENKREVISRNPRSEFTKISVQLYVEAANFREAESFGKSVILPMIRFFSSDEIVQIVTGAKDNRQIWEASGTKDVIIRLFDGSIQHFQQTKIAWKEFIERALRSYEENDYYGYPELQERLKIRGVTFTIPKPLTLPSDVNDDGDEDLPF